MKKSLKNQNLPIVKIVQEKEKFLASLVSFNSRTLAVLAKALDRKSSFNIVEFLMLLLSLHFCLIGVQVKPIEMGHVLLVQNAI